MQLQSQYGNNGVKYRELDHLNCYTVRCGLLFAHFSINCKHYFPYQHTIYLYNNDEKNRSAMFGYFYLKHDAVF